MAHLTYEENGNTAQLSKEVDSSFSISEENTPGTSTLYDNKIEKDNLNLLQQTSDTKRIKGNYWLLEAAQPILNDFKKYLESKTEKRRKELANAFEAIQAEKSKAIVDAQNVKNSLSSAQEKLRIAHLSFLDNENCEYKLKVSDYVCNDSADHLDKIVVPIIESSSKNSVNIKDMNTYALQILQLTQKVGKLQLLYLFYKCQINQIEKKMVELEQKSKKSQDEDQEKLVVLDRKLSSLTSFLSRC